ncbi:MAG: hypothetical protein KDC80_27655 [Saprospiraceae bacterium]|nr:hypothetical protein [Saprospiraceae bacterium]
MEREDERLLWKYLDGQLTGDEELDLFQRIQTNPEIKQHLAELKILDNNLHRTKVFRMSDELKTQILNKTIYKHTVSISGTELNWKNLGSFAIFNILLLAVGTSVIYFNYQQFLTTNSSLISQIADAFQNPLIQIFFLISMGVFSLFILDQILLKRTHQRATTPV